MTTILLRLYHPIQLGWQRRCIRGGFSSVISRTDFFEFLSTSNFITFTFTSSPYSSCNKSSQLNSSSSYYRYSICGRNIDCISGSASVYGSERQYIFGGSTRPSYAQHPLQLKLFQSRESSSNIGRGNRRYEDPEMRVCQSIEELTQMAYDHISTMSPRGMSAFWSSVPKLLRKSRLEKAQNIEEMNHQLEDILGYTLQDINSFDSRDLATTAISLAKIVKNVSSSDGKRLPRYGTPQRVLYDLIVGEKEFIFKVLAAPSMIILHKFEARHLSNLIYAYGLADYVIKFEDDGSTLFDVFAQSAIPNLHTFNGQDLSNMLWSYANVGISNSQLFEQAGDSIVDFDNLNEFWPQALSNIIWAFATLNEQHPQLFKKVSDHIVRLDDLNDFRPQHLSNILLAYATSDEQHPMLFEKLADHIVRLESLDRYDPQAFSNTLWAYATAEEHHSQLFKKVGDHIVQLDNLNDFWPQALKDLVWAFATAEESHPQLFNKLADEAIKRQHEFEEQHIANFLWAFATNGLVDVHLFSSFVPSVKANLDEYTAQGLVNIAWAYSVANANAPSVFNNEFINSCLKKEDEFELEALVQLHQWQLWQDEIKSDISLPSSLKKRCYEAFTSQEIKQSKLQDDVVSSLSSIGLQPQEEVLLKSGYRIDAVVEVNRKQIAVEVDGPSHFIGSRELTGSTILKHRQVAAIDEMKVVSISYWEWDKLKKDRKKKEQYLRARLGI